MEVDESINNDESQQRNVYGSLIDGVHTTEMFVPSRTHVRVALATEYFRNTGNWWRIETTMKPWSCLK